MSDRCAWCGDDPLYVSYHDHEWGVPNHDSRSLWEQLILEGFQSGLSWITILRKREGFRSAFAGFDPDLVAKFGPPEVEKLLSNAGIVRHRGKIEAAIRSAKAWQDIETREGFAAYIWRYVDGQPITNTWQDLKEGPGKTALSDRLSKDLKKAGFGFCGPTTVYAFMQAAGLVNDHIVTCPRHAQIKAMAV